MLCAHGHTNLELRQNTFGHGNQIGNNNVTIGHVDGNVYLHQKINKTALAKWISDLDFSMNQSQALEKRTAGTLEWVFKDSAFNAWFTSGTGGILWGRGKPGAGKTTFSAFVIDYLQNQSDKDPSVVAAVCYIYCRYYKTLTVLQLFEVILKQLVLCCPSLDLSDLQKLKDQGRRPTLDYIIAKLKDWSSTIPNIFIVVDAFDECFTEQTRHQALEHLKTLTLIKTLITSRPLPSIAGAMHGVLMLIISAHDEDVKTYFRAQTHLNGTMARLVSKLPEKDIEGEIIQKSDGMFLLVELHVSNLAAQTSPKQFVRALETLPKEATTTYEQTLDRIRQQDPNKRQLAFRTLSWIFEALCPLQMIELRHALAIQDLDEMADEDDLDDEETIISSCAGLIMIDAGPGNRKTVQLFHYTLREFLEYARTTSDFLSEIEVARTCLKVISFPGVHSSPPNYPLVSYAASAWGPLVSKHENDGSILQLALSQLSNPVAVKVLGRNRIRSELLSYCRRYMGRCGAAAIHIIAVYGLVKICKAFIAMHHTAINTLISVKDNDGCTALIWAVRNGQLEVAKVLLGQPNVDINAGDSNLGRSPMSWAVMNGDLELIRELFLHSNVDINSKDKVYGRTPLSWAAGSGRLEVIKELLRHPDIDVNAQDKIYGRTPFIWAAQNGHIEAFKTILSHRSVDINSKDRERGQTLLSWAAENGNLVVIKELLDRSDININLKDNSGRTPVFWAITNKHIDAARELLSHPNLDVNLEDGESAQTLLFWSAQNEQLGILQALLQHSNVDVNPQDRESGQIPLSCAARKGHSEIFEALLNHPNVDVNFRDGESGETLLFWASQTGSLEVVQALLRHPRVDVNMQDDARFHSQTPLSSAVEKGHLEIVRLLLSHPNIDVNLNTPLLQAARHGHLEVFQALLSHPDVDRESGDTLLSWVVQARPLDVIKTLLSDPRVNVNMRDARFDDQTPLSLAVRKGHLEIVRLLLSHPNINANLNTLLFSAAEHGHSEVFQALLSHPDADRESGDTLLSWAVEAGFLDVTKTLLSDPRVNVNARSGSQTPLSSAVQKGHLEIVRLLLSHPNIDVNLDTPLFRAAQLGYLEVFQALLSHPDVDVNLPDREFGDTTLSWAAQYGGLEIVRRLLSHSSVDVNLAGRIIGLPSDFWWFHDIQSPLFSPKRLQMLGEPRSRAPLSRAAEEGHLELVRELLKHPNVDINLVDEADHTPLSVAVKNKHLRIVREFLRHPGIKPDLKDKSGLTPLAWAVALGEVAIVELLINRPDVDINAGEALFGFTPLIFATELEHLPLVNLLIDSGKIELPKRILSGARESFKSFEFFNR